MNLTVVTEDNKQRTVAHREEGRNTELDTIQFTKRKKGEHLKLSNVALPITATAATLGCAFVFPIVVQLCCDSFPKRSRVPHATWIIVIFVSRNIGFARN